MKHLWVLAFAVSVLAGCARDHDDDDRARMGDRTTSEGRNEPRDRNSRAPTEAVKVKDPVCGMLCDKNTARSYEHDGKMYYFCSDECRSKFKKDPGSYLAVR